jgi:hypothetical protein
MAKARNEEALFAIKREMERTRGFEKMLIILITLKFWQIKNQKI